MKLGISRKSRPTKARRAAILGCGPSGLFAAHALQLAGYEYDIFSRARPSALYGAQYLHEPIPSLRAEPTTLRYLLRGSTDDYRRKVYGGIPAGPVSPEVFSPDPTQAWGIRAAYADAWYRYGGAVKDTEITAGWILEELAPQVFDGTYSLVVNSIPRPSLCLTVSPSVGSIGPATLPHFFLSVEAWAIGDAPGLGQAAPDMGIPAGHVVCNGNENPAWYRSANIFGHCTTEWPVGNRPPIPEVVQIRKPIRTNCDCFGELPLLHVGRYGRWEKGELSHNAFFRTLREVGK